MITMSKRAARGNDSEDSDFEVEEEEVEEEELDTVPPKRYNHNAVKQVPFKETFRDEILSMNLQH